MEETVRNQLKAWASQYNTAAFIQDDPVRFPHRFVRKQDIEISGFLTAWIAYGRRSLILQKAEWLHSHMGESPYAWICSGSFRQLTDKRIPQGRDTFYRFYTFSDLSDLCERLFDIYIHYHSMEDAFAAASGNDPIEKLQALFQGIAGIPVSGGNSACKRLAMFLRWMVRRDRIVDFGIWESVLHPSELLIPLDTHVYQISTQLGLTDRKTATRKTAAEITEKLAEIFPGDPCLGDFALFGYDINKDKNERRKT